MLYSAYVSFHYVALELFHCDGGGIPASHNLYITRGSEQGCLEDFGGPGAARRNGALM